MRAALERRRRERQPPKPGLPRSISVRATGACSASPMSEDCRQSILSPSARADIGKSRRFPFNHPSSEARRQGPLPGDERMRGWPRLAGHARRPGLNARNKAAATGAAKRETMASVNDIRSAFLDYFAREGHEIVPSEPARAAQRPDADVHQCRHGPVQGLFHRQGAAALSARRDRAEMRARRRQAQRPRQCRLHRAPPHLLRDARQFLLRRLFQGARDRACLEPRHQGIRARRRTG